MFLSSVNKQRSKVSMFLPSDCKCVNGLCNEGIDGDGRCYCQHGWKGPFCNICKYKYVHNVTYYIMYTFYIMRGDESFLYNYIIFSISLIDQLSCECLKHNSESKDL